MRMSARSKRVEEEIATLAALSMEGDCVLDFCLERDSYDSIYTLTRFSVLIHIILIFFTYSEIHKLLPIMLHPPHHYAPIIQP